MEPVTFTVPGDPRGKGRPRATSRGKRVRLYTDQKTADYEAHVADVARVAMAGRDPFEGPVRVYATVTMRVPKSVSRLVRDLMLSGAILPVKKPDLDNVVKAVLDGLNGVAFVDDAQVVGQSAEKVYGAEPGVTVTVQP